MTNLTIMAKIVAVPGQGAFVKQEALKLIAPSRQDEGCIEYRLQSDNKDDCLFIMFEVWTSAEALQAHTETTHFQNFVKNTESKLAALEIGEMTEIS